MSELTGLALPWWGWTLLVIGALGLVGVVGALFLPDWPTPPYQTGFEAEPGTDEFVEMAAGYLNVPILRGGGVELLQNGDAFYPRMLEAIRGARESVHFEVYIFDPDEIGRQFLEAFQERARAGVDVRVLVDAFGSMKVRKKEREALTRAGVKIERFRPIGLRNLVRFYRRTHRRAIVIDGRVGFIGGAAVSKKWKGDVRNAHEWRDSMTQVTGPLVTGIQSAFASNWLYCTGEVIAGPRYYPSMHPAEGPCGLSVVSSPSDAAQPIRLLFWLSFVNARERLWICSSYFIPDEQLRSAAIARAKAGIDVRVLVPGNHTDAVPVQLAGRSYYEELLSSGIRIFEYLPAMMHAKTVVVDGRWSVVGSANMDERSMELNEENILGVADRDFAAAIEAGITQDLERCREVKLEEWRRRPAWQRGFEYLARTMIEQY